MQFTRANADSNWHKEAKRCTSIETEGAGREDRQKYMREVCGRIEERRANFSPTQKKYDLGCHHTVPKPLGAIH